MLNFGRKRNQNMGAAGLSRMPGEGDMGLFNVADSSEMPGTRSQVGGSGRPSRVMTSGGVRQGPQSTVIKNEAHTSRVLSARRQNKLNAADPGLSTRGRPTQPGLEGRGNRPSAGTRSQGRVNNLGRLRP